MNFAKEARLLVNYIEGLNSFNKIHKPNKLAYKHIGALYTDISLQSGLNYNNIVRPRVLNVLNKYPNANTVSAFNKLIDSTGLNNIIKWDHPTKLQRVYDIITYSICNDIESCTDLRNHLVINANRLKLLQIKGIGPKTLDYTLKLLSFDTVAIDRHIKVFVQEAGIRTNEYAEIKNIVEYAADFMNISRSSIDYSIWKYMSEKRKQNSIQHEFKFNCN